MQVNNVSNKPSFGMAQMSRSVKKFIAEARRVCPPEEKACFEDAVHSLETIFPNQILTKTRKNFYMIAEKSLFAKSPLKRLQAKLTGIAKKVFGIPRKIGEFAYVATNSKIRNDKVNDVKAAAAALEFSNLGIASSFGGMVSCHISVKKAPAVEAYYKKWGAFYGSPYMKK